MKLYIKQKVFTIAEKFEVKNEFGETVFYCEGSFFRIPKKFTIYDKNHEIVGEVEKVMLTLMPRYVIRDSRREVTLRKQFTFLFSTYILDNIDWKLEGNFTAHKYRLLYGNTIIMSIDKHWFTWGDSYELDIRDEDDAILALGIVLAIDRILSDDHNTANSNS